MKPLLLVLCVGLVWAVDQDAAGFDENFPEEVPGLFEGDIELQPGQNPYHRNALSDPRRRWPGGRVPYSIQSGYPSSTINTFHQAMNDIQTKSRVNGKDCITFVPKSSSDRAYIELSHGSGCHTPVGYIGRRSAVTIGHGCERKGTIIHEILHSLGMWHEQSRHDRDNYVTIVRSNIQSGHEGNFNKYELPYIDELGEPYDYGSVMHYGAYAFARDRSKMTIIPKQRGAQIGQRIGLSKIDVEEIQILYGCKPRPSGSATHPPPQVSHTNAPSGTVKPNHGGDFCSFDNGLCTWSNSRNDNWEWTRRHGATPSAHTGPSADRFGHTGSNGYYVYVEASSHTRQTARLLSKSYTGGDWCVDFYYHMYGSQEGYLQLNLVAGTHEYRMKQYTGDHGDNWNHVRINTHVTTSGTFQFEFLGHTGSGYHSDIAIDDVTVHSGKC